MKVGIIVYSHTGNTKSVAQKLQDKLAKAGHSVKLEQIKVSGEIRPGMTDIHFESLPDAGNYEALVFGAPVMAFSLSPVMTAYIKKLEPLKKMKIACFVTHHFPFKWMGGKQAIRQMKKFCEAKGAAVCGTGIVSWSGRNRNEQINELAESISGLF